ncbi:MAG TPA: hypothetical protein VNO30_31470 [Kofleriaceae bacterium]|nr:hypothetical protein [Kofleriaceae bacterium]
MRTLRLRLIALGAAAPLFAAGGCKWTDFDDLEADTWVTSVEKPDNPAASWGVAIARLTRDGSGGTLAVLGATDSLYNDLVIDSKGGTKITTELELNPQFAIGNLATEPLLLTSPASDEVALVSALEVSRSLVIRSSGGQLTGVPVIGPQQPSAATYMVSPPHAADPEARLQVLVAQNDAVFPAYFDQTKALMPPPKCTLRDEQIPPQMITIRALGAYRPPGVAGLPPPAFDDVLVLSESGKLMAYPGSVFNGCMGGMVSPKMGFAKDIGLSGVQGSSQILVFTDPTGTYALVQAHTDGIKGRLGLYRITDTGFEEVGAARDIDRLRTAALFQPSANVQQRYVLAGLPTADVRDVASGLVQVIELSTTTGVAAEPTLTLADAQPEDTQVFGRSVAALPYNNGKNIIAVAADNEIFLYFRTNLYDETREAR